MKAINNKPTEYFWKYIYICSKNKKKFLFLTSPSESKKSTRDREYTGCTKKLPV